MRGLLTLNNLSNEQIHDIISFSILLKQGFDVSYSGKKFSTLFFENSTRTHYSFIAALTNLGIKVVDVNITASSVNKGESLYDTIKTMEALGMDTSMNLKESIFQSLMVEMVRVIIQRNHY